MTISYAGPGNARGHYGPRETTNHEVAKNVTYGAVHELVVDLTFDKLPGLGNAGADAIPVRIPANALVLACYGEITTNFNSTSGTTTIDVGTYDADGNAIDADGFIADWGGAADGSNVGWSIGAGADIGTITSATLDTFVTVTPSVDDLTAGAGTLVIRYIPSEA